jgi:hypothetical protein
MESRKFVVDVSSALPTDAEGIFSCLAKKYVLVYVGVYDVDDEVKLYVHCKNVVKFDRVSKLIQALDIEFTSIRVCKAFQGEIVSEHGRLIKNGRPASKNTTDKKRNIQHITHNNVDQSTTNNYVINQNIIIVNPIGSETTEHITQEFIQDLLDQGLGKDTVFRFGTRMYSEPSNMNFVTDRKDGYVKGRIGDNGIWETHEKGPAYTALFDNLSEKNREVVENFKAGLSEEAIEQFNDILENIHRDKHTINQRLHDNHKKFVRNGFNVLAENIKDKVRRMSKDSGKRVKFV